MRCSACVGALVAVGLALPVAAAAADSPLGDPSANLPLSGPTESACGSAPAGPGCTADTVAQINTARASEGVGAVALPADFATLTPAQQLLAIANLERVDRGLPPVLGLTSPLDANAATGAADHADPRPTEQDATAWYSNWAGGRLTPLEADFEWMYDDGAGSGNEDCAFAGESGCWGHRHDILAPLVAPAVMGAAVAPASFGSSLAEIFASDDSQTGAGQADAPPAPVIHDRLAPAHVAAGKTVTVSGSLTPSAGVSRVSLETVSHGRLVRVASGPATRGRFRIGLVERSPGTVALEVTSAPTATLRAGQSRTLTLHIQAPA